MNMNFSKVCRSHKAQLRHTEIWTQLMRRGRTIKKQWKGIFLNGGWNGEAEDQYTKLQFSSNNLCWKLQVRKTGRTDRKNVVLWKKVLLIEQVDFVQILPKGCCLPNWPNFLSHFIWKNIILTDIEQDPVGSRYPYIRDREKAKRILAKFWANRSTWDFVVIILVKSNK